MPSPKIWQMIIDNQIQACTVPSGILFHVHRESAAGCPGVLTKVGMDIFVDPRRQGARMNKCTTEEIVRLVNFEGDEWLFFPSIPPDIAIIRAATSDEHGNLPFEHEGAYRGAFDQALAARNKVILVCEPSELRSLGDTARRSVAPESTTTLVARELRSRDQ
jgi:propionate CoA-transferase